jgi:hypothetical protein
MRWYLLVLIRSKVVELVVGVLVHRTQALLDCITPSCPAVLSDHWLNSVSGPQASSKLRSGGLAVLPQCCGVKHRRYAFAGSH